MLIGVSLWLSILHDARQPRAVWLPEPWTTTPQKSNMVWKIRRAPGSARNN
jgi:hypothetical protein